MNSSSDESFAWEKASSGSDDADIENPTMNWEDDEVIHESSNGDKVNNYVKEPKAKKRKHIVEENDYDDVEIPNKNKIKTEPESDLDSRKKKKKKADMSGMNSYLNNSIESDLHYNDEYLDICIKQEKVSLGSPNHVKPKKSKKHVNNVTDMDSIQENGGDSDITKKEKKSKKKKKPSDTEISINGASFNEIPNIFNNTSHNLNSSGNDMEDIQQPNRKSPKKKKSKDSRKSKIVESSDIEDKLNSEETKLLEYADFLKLSRNSDNNDDTLQNNVHCSKLQDSLSEIHIESHSCKPSEKTMPKSLTDETLTSLKKKALKPILQSTPNNMGSQANNNPGRLLDRICFEEDPDSDLDKTQDSNDISPYLHKYLKHNENLQLVTKLFEKSSEITPNDEVWILKCPHDIDIKNLHNTDLNLDGKSKIKMNGETYCGNFDENVSKLTILTSNENNFLLKNIVASGTIHFRKRLPKPHVQDHNVMVNNQTDFIPLPETKCRHPLFGSNYKDAINVRVPRVHADTTVADVEIFTAHGKKKKKKHKKDQGIIPKVEVHTTDISLKKSPKREIESDVPVKNSKKRKHAHDDENCKKKSKRIKLEPDSVEAWESEKAIEENLFNF